MNFSRLKPISGVYLTLKPEIDLLGNILLDEFITRISDEQKTHDTETYRA